jgi:hypothetical protein
MDDVAFIGVTHKAASLGYPISLLTPLKPTNPASLSLLAVAQRIASENRSTVSLADASSMEAVGVIKGG